MSGYTRFGSWLTDCAKNNSLPGVMFTSNGDMRGSLGRLADLAFGKSSMDETQILGSVESFNRVISNEANARHCAIFRNVPAIMGNKLKDGITELRKTHRLVSKMCSVLQERINARYSGDAVLAQLTGANSPLTLPVIDWKVFNIIDERSVRTNIHVANDRDINEKVTPTLLSIIVNKLPYSSPYRTATVEKIVVDDNKMNKIVDALHNRLPNIDHSHLVGILRNIFDLTETSMRGMANRASMLASGKSITDLVKFATLACEYVQVIDQLKPELLDLSNQTMAEYSKHADVYMQYAETLLYIASYWRNDVWKESVLLPGGFVNGDVYGEYSEKGGTMNDIVRFKNYMYAKIPIPLKGVKSEAIMSSVQSIKESISTIVTNKTRELTEEKKRIERDCFIAVATEYFNGNKDKLDPRFAYRNNISGYAAAVFDASAHLPVETRFYKLLMGGYHINDMVSTLYGRLETAYTASSEKLGSIDNEDKLRIETAVYADMVVQYLIDSGILII